jgi:hypothetical protein
VKAGFSCGDLKVTLANIFKELGWPDDQVNERPNKWEQCTSSGAADKESIGDSTLRIGVGPIDECKPDDYDNGDKEVREDVHLGSLSPCFKGSSSNRGESLTVGWIKA